MNQELFERIKVVYGQKDSIELTPEQTKLLENAYNGFIRRGANLQGEAKEKYRELTKNLSKLTLDFSENNLKETNNYQLTLTDEAQLAGLPESAIEAAAETAREKGLNGWVFTLHAPSYIPFMTYADNRDLRRELYMAYNTKCTHDNEYGTWSANGESNAFSASVKGSENDPLGFSNKFVEGLNRATSYKGNYDNLFIYYKDEGGRELCLVFHVDKDNNK